MTSRSKIDEVQFYLDRGKDALVTLIRSIIQNPRISDEERLQALKMLGEHHAQIASFISERIAEGERKARELLQASNAPSPEPDPRWDS